MKLVTWERRQPAGKLVCFHSRNRPAHCRRSQDFHVWKLPEVRVDHAGGALADEEFAGALNDKRDEASGGGGVALAEVGESFLYILFSRAAE